LKDLLLIVVKIRTAKATFTSLTEHLDTKGPAGEALMQMIGVFAQFERSMISERTQLGVRQAIADGKKVGRPIARSGEAKAFNRIHPEWSEDTSANGEAFPRKPFGNQPNDF